MATHREKLLPKGKVEGVPDGPGSAPRHSPVTARYHNADPPATRTPHCTGNKARDPELLGQAAERACCPCPHAQAVADDVLRQVRRLDHQDRRPVRGRQRDSDRKRCD